MEQVGRGKCGDGWRQGAWDADRRKKIGPGAVGQNDDNGYGDNEHGDDDDAHSDNYNDYTDTDYSHDDSNHNMYDNEDDDNNG